MTLQEIITAVRIQVRDTDSAVFPTNEITYFINEGINRVRQSYYFTGMEELSSSTDVPSIMPTQYHHLLSLYAVSRCFTQDMEHYQAARYMNEFEDKLLSLISQIDTGEIIVTDSEGEEIEADYEDEFVQNEYFGGVTNMDNYTPPDGF